MARRLKTIARYINENVDGLSAKICEGFYQSERKLFARISSFGKSRTGNRIIIHVTGHPDWILRDHNSVEPYRTNDEVESLLRDWGKRQGLFNLRGLV